MKVLFVNENIGGHVTTHLHLRRALETCADIDARFLDVPARGIGRRVVGAPVPGLARLDLDLQPLRAQLAASAWTRRHLAAHLTGVDVVHVFTHNAALLSAGQLRRVPAVVALDGTDAMNAYYLPYRAPTRFTPWTVAATQVFERRVYAAADRLVATSATAARSLREEYGIGEDRLRTIHYGVFAPKFAPDAAPGTRAELPRLVFVGRGMERKGGNRLLRIHQERFADRCALVLVTEDAVPPARNVIVVNDLQPGDPRLWEILRDGSVFVFPSLIDQQPNAVMEALAAGLPVIAYPVNAITEMVDDGVTGLFPTDRCDAALAAAVEQLIACAETRHRMGTAGRALFDRRFSAVGTVARLAEVLREAAARHAAGGTR